MKKEKRRATVKLNRRNGKVESGSCTCAAGNSAYCNQILRLLFEIADYSLHQLSRVPEELSCTSRLRQGRSLVRNTYLNHLLCKLS